MSRTETGRSLLRRWDGPVASQHLDRVVDHAPRDATLTVLEDVRTPIETLLRATPEVAALQIRALMGRLARLFQVALLLEQVSQDASTPASVLAIARLLLHLAAGDDPTGDPDYPALIAAVLA